jgi:hypothetical protein
MFDIKKWKKCFIEIAQRDGHLPRLDAGETAMFDRSLTQTVRKGLKKDYPELKARQFVPANTEKFDSAADSVNPWVEVGNGQAGIMTNMSQDIPLITMTRLEEAMPCLWSAAKWGVSVDQLRAASLAEYDLNSSGLSETIRKVKKGIDDLLSTGNANRGLKGFANHSDITPMALTTGTWSGATVAQILVDIQDLIDAVISNSNDVYQPSNLALAPSLYAYTNQMVPNTIMNIREYVLKNTSIEEVDKWNVLETAGAAADPRIICYKKDKNVLNYVVTQEVEIFPPQLSGLEYESIVRSRCAGVLIANTSGVVMTDAA